MHSAVKVKFTNIQILHQQRFSFVCGIFHFLHFLNLYCLFSVETAGIYTSQCPQRTLQFCGNGSVVVMKSRFLTVLSFPQAFFTVYPLYEAALKDFHTLFGHFSDEKGAFLV